MLQFFGLQLEGDECDVEQGRGHLFAIEHASLAQVQAARAERDDRVAGINGDGAVALAVEIAEFAAQRRKDVGDALREVWPGIGDGIFQIEHDAWSARVQHLHDEFGVIGRAGHLIALILAPFRQLDAPGGLGGLGSRQVVGQLAPMRGFERCGAASDQIPLARCEGAVQWQ